ncbi:MAG: PAS domain-containing protein [Candidatus Margulisiibacteriota bacterium]
MNKMDSDWQSQELSKIVKMLIKRDLELTVLQESLEKQVAERTKELAALLFRNESLVEALGEIVYDHILPKDEVIWGGEYERVLGYDKEQMGNDGRSWTDKVHPQDLAAVLKEFDAAAKGRRLYDLEYRFKCRDGSYLWVHDRGVMNVNDKGEVERVIGIMLNITERKQAEEKLREKVAELEEFHNLAVGRELKMIEMEKEVNALLKELGREQKY